MIYLYHNLEDGVRRVFGFHGLNNINPSGGYGVGALLSSLSVITEHTDLDTA